MKSNVNAIWKLFFVILFLLSTSTVFSQTIGLHVDQSGNVGVGTTAVTGYKLSVNGGIIAEEVKVVINVPQSDFVFEEGYKPATLPEIEEYVKEHKHLPGIPSAEEF